MSEKMNMFIYNTEARKTQGVAAPAPVKENGDHFLNLLEREAAQWSLENREPVVGWYDAHNADKNEELLFRGTPIMQGKLALEYGCGPGRNLIKFKNYFRRIDGADRSQGILSKVPLNLGAAGFQPQGEQWPLLFLTNGHSLQAIAAATYDVVFSLICMQHISCREWRLDLYKEFYRVLVPGGFFCFQMGFGPGHGHSVDYFHGFDDTDNPDVRVENVADLQKDIEDNGFVGFDHIFTEPCHDLHPQWIWVRCQKPL
jgi:SAM-dependent methyltransferase